MVFGKKKRADKKGPAGTKSGDRQSAYTEADLKLLRDTHGHVAYAVMPVEGDPEAAKPSIEKLRAMGLLSDDRREPQLTRRGRVLCEVLARRDWTR